MVTLPEFALVDPVTLNTGLFRSLPKGARPVLDAKKEQKDLAYRYAGHHVIKGGAILDHGSAA
ncbi:hypothetical protein, partial [Aliiroseovarius marinus]|uniref:hypothetical protein n=1 Tax=Aliiroseovarius marinus TaxID=2500159 RepID=UPI00196A38A9